MSQASLRSARVIEEEVETLQVVFRKLDSDALNEAWTQLKLLKNKLILKLEKVERKIHLLENEYKQIQVLNSQIEEMERSIKKQYVEKETLHQQKMTSISNISESFTELNVLLGRVDNNKEALRQIKSSISNPEHYLLTTQIQELYEKILAMLVSLETFYDDTLIKFYKFFMGDEELLEFSHDFSTHLGIYESGCLGVSIMNSMCKCCEIKIKCLILQIKM